VEGVGDPKISKKINHVPFGSNYQDKFRSINDHDLRGHFPPILRKISKTGETSKTSKKNSTLFDLAKGLG